jgi:hypothetical protein
MLQQIGRRSCGTGDIEQDVASRRLSAAATRRMDEGANLLIAWPRETELLGDPADPAICLRERVRRSIEALGSSHEAGIDPRSAGCHLSSMRASA